MSGDLLLGTFGDLTKVQHQIEATLNNNGVATKCEKFVDMKREEEEEEEKQSQKTVPTEKNEEESPRSLHTFKKGERAKMLADGYTKG